MVSVKEYLYWVMQSYFKDYGGEDVSYFLMNPTVGKLKDLSRFLLQQKRYLTKDRLILNKFLNINNDIPVEYLKEEDFDKAILGHDYNEFKRVVQFINRYEKNPKHQTDVRNINFIAWLIDFRPRPYSIQLNSIEDDNDGQADNLLGKTGYYKSEKELHVLKQLLFDKELLKEFRQELLNKVLKDYKLENNQSFVDYRKQLGDYMTMQAYTISRLEAKVNVLQKQLRRARRTRRLAGGLGLFFVGVDYREPSVDNVFEDLLDELSGCDDDDLLDDIL